ncbi:DUF2291 family protein [Paludibaculum fermentans]|uniref:DUF2291 family protein n=1 Tax=Paludibaculum fermentans TaxID=1473598 RepID=A0A7S7SJZ0_PALFE|nr:DUF2291 family protein [Paludibaculum fermentans]QOY88597.1 DUF2291 family protein [Paludibaculum fermentans]
MKRACAAILSLSLTACVPWTVRPIEGQSAAAAQDRFDATRFVDSQWQTKILPAIEASAVDVSGLPAASSRKAGTHFILKGTARVLKVNPAPPLGQMSLDFEPFDGHADAVLQIGPEVRGSSLRDATGLVQFSQFVNQIDFANVSSKLNARALQCLPPTAEIAGSEGRRIAFTGTFTAGDEIPHIVPVRFRWVEGVK